MTTPSNTEIDKAIEIVIKFINGNEGLNPYVDISICKLITATKRLKEVEKENGMLRECNVQLVASEQSIRNESNNRGRELSQLRSQYAGANIECEAHVKENRQLRETLKECARNLGHLVSDMEALSTFHRHGATWNTMQISQTLLDCNKALSHPLVQPFLSNNGTRPNP